MFSLNNKGQSLVMFIIIFPIFLFIITLIYDVGNAIYEKNSLSNINYIVVEYALLNIDTIREEDIVDLINENDNDVNDISIMIINNSVDITLEKDIKGVFGKIFDFNLTSVRSEYKGEMIDNKTKIERVKWYYG